MQKNVILTGSIILSLAACNSPNQQTYGNPDLGALGMRLMAAGQPLTSAQRAAVLSGTPMPATYYAPAPAAAPLYTPPPPRAPTRTNCWDYGTTINCTTQ